jgi:hypothetical protein
MAYRVTSDAATGSRTGARRCGDGALSRNATIVGVTLASLTLIAAGAALLGRDRDVGSIPNYVSSHSALKVALVEPAAQAQMDQVAGLAANAVASDVRVKSAAAASLPPPPAAPQIASAERIPLPAARPRQADAPVLAAIPLPRPRAVDTEPTGSLGTPRDMAVVQLPALALAPVPLAREPTAALAFASARPAHESIKMSAKTPGKTPAKPPHQLTAQDKLYGPVRLASLTPPDAIRDDSSRLPRAPYDRQTAVYVITSKTLYMPDGTEFEAHSGLGSRLDDPRFVSERMRGATPPHVYDLSMRESLFHGVEAIRLTPIGDEREIFNRDGLLAHPYMLGPRGESNGCVSVKDYDEFLDAFKAGKISRLAVIARLD